MMKNMKIKFNSDDKLPLNKTIQIPNMIIVVRATFHEINKYYPQVFLDECLYKLQTRKKETKSFYILLAFLLITIALLIAVSICCYLIKYKPEKTLVIILCHKKSIKRSSILIIIIMD